MEHGQKKYELPLLPADKVLFHRQVQRELDEIRQEVEEACVLDNEIDPVPDSAYHDASSVIEILFYNNVPLPDIGWLMDGGIGFEWRSADGKGIGTMSIYGDKQVVYGASLRSRRIVKGTCKLTDYVKLDRLFPMLRTL